MNVIAQVKAVLTRRRQAHTEAGTLAQTVSEAMRIWDAQKADGVSQAERIEGLERTLRVAWPQTREWKYYCQLCGDLGWQFLVCSVATPCGRPFTFPQQRADDHTGRGHCADGHRYVVPCSCSRGDEKRRSLVPAVKNRDVDYVEAGRSKPTRIGR